MVIKWYLHTRKQGVSVETMRKIYRVLPLLLIINLVKQVIRKLCKMKCEIPIPR